MILNQYGLITNDYNSGYKFLLNEAGNSAMEINTAYSALEIFKTSNNLKNVTDSNGILTHNHLVR